MRSGAACAAAVARWPRPSSAEAAAKDGKKTEAGKPELIASFGDWNVFVGQAGKGRICYALAQPKAREPEGSNATRATPSSRTAPPKGCATKSRSSWASTFPADGSGHEADAKRRQACGETRREDGRQAGRQDSGEACEGEAKGKTKSIPAPVATVGEQSFDLLPKGGDLWVKNAARESALIAEMKKGVTLEIKAASIKGNESTDSYSLSGFSQAMERLQKECPSKQ